MTLLSPPLSDTPARVLRNDAEAYPEIRSAASKFVAEEGTFSMVTTERVIYDYSVPGKESPVCQSNPLGW